MKKVGTLWMWAAVLALVCLSGAWAFEVDPARQELRLRPDHSMTTKINVTNDSRDIVQVNVSEKDWFVLEQNKKFPVDTWLTIHGDKQFPLPPGQSRKVKVTVKAPKGAQGELVGMVSFLYQTKGMSMVTPIISVSVYALIEGTEKAGGAITELTLRDLGNKQLQAAVVVKASGNVHLRPAGHVSVVDDSGREVCRIDVPEAGPTYPGQDKGYFGVSPNTQLAPGHYLAKAELISTGLLMQATQDYQVSADGQLKKVEPTKS